MMGPLCGCLARCGRCCVASFVVWLYFAILFVWQRSTPWSWSYEWDVRCDRPPLPTNQSGVKVLVAGFAKTGTWAMTKNLLRIYSHAYHSEDFMVHVWHHIAKEYWARPENGAQLPPAHHPLLLHHYSDRAQARTGIRPISDIELSMRVADLNETEKYLPAEVTKWLRDIEENGRPMEQRFPNDGLKVAAATSSEALARQISSCGVQAITFDGIEDLFWPIYEASPGAKIITLDWRSYDAWHKSQDRFGKTFVSLTVTTNLLYSSIQGLPYGILIRQLDRWLGGPVEEMLRTGRAFSGDEYNIPMQLWASLTFQRDVAGHWWGGLINVLIPRKVYESFYREVRERTAPENLLRWNPKENTWEDLCKFLEVQDCPDSGVFKHVPNVNAWDKLPWEEVQEPMMLAPIFLVCHWINWKLYRALLSLAYRVLRSSCWLCRSLCRRREKNA